jgi:peptide deformylase
LTYQVLEKHSTDKNLPDVEITEDLLKTAHEFFTFAKSVEDRAVGLAAPQTGVDLRMCAAKTPYWIMAINPKIVQTLGVPFRTKEGCLTWPETGILATRYSNVEVEFYNLESQRVEKHWYSGLSSIIWQHELDHLNGIQEPDTEQVARKTLQVKLGRNELCHCGSGRKFKKCCLPIMDYILGVENLDLRGEARENWDE